ncbi:uncharacterized protein LOC144790943 [Lissotriton helveticus]
MVSQKNCMLSCFSCNSDSQLEDSCLVPPIGTPLYDLYCKFGVGPISYNEIWIRYTEKDGVLSWPLHGSFEPEILDNLERRLFKKKARPAMFDSFRYWRKESKQREIKKLKKEQKEQELTLEQSARQLQLNESEKAMEVADRERNLAIDKCYPALPSSTAKIVEDPEKDPLLSYLLRSPPPYAQGATAPPIPNVQLPVAGQPGVPVLAPLNQVPVPPVVNINVPSTTPLLGLPTSLPMPVSLTPATSQANFQATPTVPDLSVPTATLFTASANIMTPLSVRRRITDSVSNILSPFYKTLIKTPTSDSVQRRSQLPSTEERGILDSTALRWVSKVGRYNVQNVLDTFMQWNEPTQRYVFDEMCFLLREELEEDDPESNLGELINVQKEFATGMIVGQNIKEAMELVLSYRSDSSLLSPRELEKRSTKRNRQYPMREVPPIWREAVQANAPLGIAAAPAQFQRVWIHIPWKRAEVLAVKQALPDPRKNPAGYYKELAQTVDACVLNLTDIDLLFGNVVPQPIWAKIRKENHPVALGGDWAAIIAADGQQIGGSKPEPLIANLPGRIIDLMKTLMPALRVNWDKLSACKQKKDESVSDFFTRFEETFVDHSGQDMSTEGGQRLFVDKFVHNLLPELSSKLKNSESAWAVSTTAQILATAQYYENRDKEEKEKSDKKTKDLKTKVLLQQAYPPRMNQTNMQQGSYQRTDYNFQRPQYQWNQCAYCKKEGHYKSECPVRTQNNDAAAQRGRGSSMQNSRGRGRGAMPPQTSDRPSNYFDQRNGQSAQQNRSPQYHVEDYYEASEEGQQNEY